MKKLYISMIGSFILACIFGFWGRSMSHFLSDHILSSIKPVSFLFILTSLTVILFVIAFVAAFFLFKNKHVDEKKLILYHTIIGFVGVPTSFWSVLVFLRWIS